MMAHGEKMWLEFVNLKDGSLFAKCILPEKIELALIPTVDSSRAWAITMIKNGKKALAGLYFRERNDAFDFKTVFADYKVQLELERNPEKVKEQLSGQNVDFSIKQGEKFSLDFGGKKQEKH